ncbi:OsmC family protein [Nitratifractor salsuginis]|uniref:OsmC family protein n=1 Tax=Nitratifractor salsuginis (strain DSM 16511 / JCM 12458 / E9I37-1) TaxID=749222 RepID=E6WYY5_NITSE|nr:OsmC family protein [Nitratifractor salsuginis]ADV46571.1 OsmC family protein [Nitratifractor salsuginis DSM 16511]
MTISLDYLGDNKFKAKTGEYAFLINANEITPVEYFAAGILGCTGIDIAAFAERDGYELRDYSVEGEIERRMEPPVKFESLHIIYRFSGRFDPVRARRYVLSSLESYCTTVNSIRDSVKISYSIIYNGETIVEKEEILSGCDTERPHLEDGFDGVCCRS